MGGKGRWQTWKELVRDACMNVEVEWRGGNCMQCSAAPHLPHVYWSLTSPSVSFRFRRVLPTHVFSSLSNLILSFFFPPAAAWALLFSSFFFFCFWLHEREIVTRTPLSSFFFSSAYFCGSACMFVFNDACECVSEIWNCAAFLFFFSFGSVCMCVLFFSSCAKLKCRDGGDKKATERRRDSLVFYSRFFFFLETKVWGMWRLAPSREKEGIWTAAEYYYYLLFFHFTLKSTACGPTRLYNLLSVRLCVDFTKANKETNRGQRKRKQKKR